MKSRKAMTGKKARFVLFLLGRAFISILLIILQIVFFIAAGNYITSSTSILQPFLLLAIYVIEVIALVKIINRDWKPEFKLAWAIPICSIPVFGILFYIFLRYDATSVSMKRKLKRSLAKEYYDKEKYARGKSGLIYYLCKCGFPSFADADVTYFPSGEDKFACLLEELKKAEKFIFIEYFIMSPGFMLSSILEILFAKAKEGVEIRIMYDGTTDAVRLPFDFKEYLAENGVKCAVFSPIKPLISSQLNYRDHRKIVVIDGRVAFTGGVNIADEYINKTHPYGHWKDAAVMVTGNCVKSFTEMFLKMWNFSCRRDDADGDTEKYFPALPYDASGESYCVPFSDDPINEEDIAESVFLDILNRSREYVYIMTPYFIVNSSVFDAIKYAVKRGVDVRIILPHIPDKKYALNIARTYYKTLIPIGVKIYEYSPGFIHSKVLAADGIKAVVGTINMDFRSMYLNYECALYIRNNPVIADIKADFDSTFEKCELIGINKKYNIFSRIEGVLLKLFAPLM